jgi:hypothetical protein
MEEAKTPPANNAAPATAQTDPKAPAAASSTAGKAPIPSDMHVKVYSPYKTYFDGRANSFSAVNDTGPFDILPGHRNFMTLVSPCELVIRSDKGEDKIKIARAVMHVKANDIVVFLDV